MKMQLRTFAVVFIILMAAWGSAQAQVVDIPDQQLRVAVYDALGIPTDASVTRADMLQLTDLDLIDRGIEDLSGLEFATNLTWLRISYNPVTDLRPIARLTKLTELQMYATAVSDITPLGNLTSLRTIHANYCQIADISPLANLLKLEELFLEGNAITDVTPLANLPKLDTLYLRNNTIFDHSPLDGLSLTHFEYDNYQPCNEPPRPLQPRLENRNFPLIFSAWGGVGWSPVLNQPHLSDVEQMAQHDLYWCCLHWDHTFRRNGDAWELWGTTEMTSMDFIYKENPDMINLAGLSFPPEDPEYLTDPDVQRDIIQRAIAVANCGLYDGVFFDYWGGFRYSPGVQNALVEIVKGIRDNTRENFLIIGNTNHNTAPATGAYINGLFLESAVPGGLDTPESLERNLLMLEDTLSWAEKNLRTPRVNALEGMAYADEPLDSPANLRSMRAITTLSLTFSDGYVLFRTPWWEGVHQHWHYWYNFWDADLGQPVGPKSQLYDDAIPGLYIREFTNGWAVYNHSGAPQVVTLPEKLRAVASGLVNTKHALPNLDGEIYLRVKPASPADVNGDGVVNIFDLTIVAQAIGTNDRQGDVNGDGMINVFDLVVVANAF